MLNSKFFFYGILMILLFGMYGTSGLVMRELEIGNGCPKLFGIPACYIIMLCFLLAFLSHVKVIKDKSKMFFIGVLIALSIASYGSIGQLMGFAECPKTTNGIPMCYLSFVLFSSLFVLKFLHIRLFR